MLMFYAFNTLPSGPGFPYSQFGTTFPIHWNHFLSYVYKTDDLGFYIIHPKHRLTQTSPSTNQQAHGTLHWIKKKMILYAFEKLVKTATDDILNYNMCFCELVLHIPCMCSHSYTVYSVLVPYILVVRMNAEK